MNEDDTYRLVDKAFQDWWESVLSGDYPPIDFWFCCVYDTSIGEELRVYLN